MRARQLCGLAALIIGCTKSSLLHAQQATPVIPFVPDAAHTWPLWPTQDGWLIGGSGFVTGQGPFGVTPGIGMGNLLLPSRRIGTLEGFPGEPPKPPSGLPTSAPVWMDASAVATYTADDPFVLVPTPSGPSPQPVMLRWTKMGLTPLPPPKALSWPDLPFSLSPWGPVVWQAGPNAAIPTTTDAKVSAPPRLDLGFPTADGTPLSAGTYRAFIRRYRGMADIVFYNYVTRTLHVPPSLKNVAETAAVRTSDGHLLVTPRDPGEPLRLIDLLSGGIDPLLELRDAVRDVTGNFYRRAESIVYTVDAPGARRVQLFDRRQRVIDPLSHLNAALENYVPASGFQGRWLAFVTTRFGSPDIAVYDMAKGFVDPLPGVNTPAIERTPCLTATGQWLAYITEVSGRPEARLYDRHSRMIDTLPELNSLGPVSNIGMTGDGLIMYASIGEIGHRRVVLYLRPSGFIDSLPEVNLPDADVNF